MTDLHCKVSESDIETYERDGVVCLRGMLDSAWLEELRAATEEVLLHPSARAVIDESRGGRYAYDMSLWTRHETFRRFQMSSPVPAITAQLMRSSKVYLMVDSMFVKEPNTPVPTPWHQDQPVGWYDGTQVCSVWVPLDSVTLESGALEYVVGSHRLGEWYSPHPGEMSSVGKGAVRFKAIPDVAGNRDAYDIVHFDTEPGDLLFHHMLMLHGTPGNALSERRRRAISLRYVGDDASFAQRALGLKLIRDPGLVHGDPFGCELFPQVWPPTGRLRRFWEEDDAPGRTQTPER
jgi:ectoine hydroxylase-related dioxygenase (phytanoyl-CoA dioxygenase family)